nr:hypothetical protein [Lysobacter enzymogenes]
MEGAVSRERPGGARTQSPQAPGCKQYLEDVLHKLQALVAPGHDLAEEQQAATRALFADFISGCLQMYFLHGGGTGLLAAPPWPEAAAPDPRAAKERTPHERPWYLSEVAAAPKPAETSRAIAPAYPPRRWMRRRATRPPIPSRRRIRRARIRCNRCVPCPSRRCSSAPTS